ncbi:LANO_0F16402g1_1 [Lachancea nothofagi CBS 11611]|uniref:LANO_0F16402g1_1 n=1 Tax=Lachancea nothofagi CBS 11611 TaxID=1266666 RepID=A0A1G4KCU3_9SACH|nr:LANO_0F16402g1_1 [Lachancea nothofagi CBS 11611]
MKIDSKIYQEAHRLAIMPRMKMLFYGIVCGAAVPTMYLRSYYLPHIKQQEANEISTLGSKVKLLEQHTSNIEHPAVRNTNSASEAAENLLRSSENLGALAGVGDIPIAAWHINGRNKYANDKKYRKLVEEANAIMLSSIM